MKITISPTHQLEGTDVEVVAEGDGDESVSHVTVVCDDFTLTDEDVDPPVNSYDRGFKDAASYSPGDQHTCVVTVTVADGKTKTARKTWVD
jgi:hypothetical protein